MKKRGRKPLTVKNITFTMSVTPAEAETLLKHGNTYQKAIRNLINEEKKQNWDKAVKETVEASRSLWK